MPLGCLGFAVYWSLCVARGIWPSRHGDGRTQARWGIAVEYFRFMGLGLVVMVLVRALCSGMTDRMWSERMLVLGTLLFSGTVGAESIAPDSDLLSRVGWAAPLGGVLMALSWFTFCF